MGSDAVRVCGRTCIRWVYKYHNFFYRHSKKFSIMVLKEIWDPSTIICATWISNNILVASYLTRLSCVTLD